MPFLSQSYCTKFSGSFSNPCPALPGGPLLAEPVLVPKDVAQVLCCLRFPALEPPRWESLEEHRQTTWKTVFLLALAFSCRRSELQALSKDSQDLVLWEGGMYVELSGGLVPKVGREGSPTSQTIANWISACVWFTHSQRPDLPV